MATIHLSHFTTSPDVSFTPVIVSFSTMRFLTSVLSLTVTFLDLIALSRALSTSEDLSDTGNTLPPLSTLPFKP